MSDEPRPHGPDPDDEPPPAPPPGGSGGAAKAALIVMAAALLGLAGWAIAGALEDDPHAGDPPLPELPEPGAPRTRAMVATGSGYGWTWVNPRPRSMPTWYAVDTAGGGDRVVMVGWAGAAVRYDAGSLFVWATGTDVELRGVAWTGAAEALAAGEGGALIRLHGDGRTPLESGVRVTLRDVVAASPTDAYAVGDEGTVLRVVGDRVTRLEVTTRADLLGAHARGGEVFAVGAEGTVLRIDGRTVTTEPVGVSTTLRAVGGCPEGEVYAAGDRGVLLRRRRSGAWSRVRVSGAEAFTGVACDHGRVAVTRADGEVLLVSGPRTVRLPTGFERAWHAVSGGTEGPSWLVGVGGRLATIEEDYVRTRTAGPTVPVRALGSMGGALVAVGEWGRILREREEGLEQVESPTESGLAGLIQVDEGRVIAVGDYGAIVDIRFDRASLVASPTQASLRAGVAAGQELLVVGAGGAMLRGTMDALLSSVVPGVGDLWAVAGSPDDAIVVGEGGVVLRVTEAGFSRVPCATEVSLRDVVRTAAGTWAVGDGGLVVRVEASGCVIERRGGPTLHAVGLGPEGGVLAAGDDGAVLTRGPAGEWSAVGVDVAQASIREVWRGPRYVYLAGTGGTLVRHIIVDGT